MMTAMRISSLTGGAFGGSCDRKRVDGFFWREKFIRGKRDKEGRKKRGRERLRWKERKGRRGWRVGGRGRGRGRERKLGRWGIVARGCVERREEFQKTWKHPDRLKRHEIRTTAKERGTGVFLCQVLRQEKQLCATDLLCFQQALGPKVCAIEQAGGRSGWCSMQCMYRITFQGLCDDAWLTASSGTFPASLAASNEGAVGLPEPGMSATCLAVLILPLILPPTAPPPPPPPPPDD